MRCSFFGAVWAFISIVQMTISATQYWRQNLRNPLPRAAPQAPRATRRTRSSHRPPATGPRPPATGHRPPATGPRPPATGPRPPATGHRPPATGHRPHAPRGGAGARSPGVSGHAGSAKTFLFLCKMQTAKTFFTQTVKRPVTNYKTLPNIQTGAIIPP
jgi:hypothetical protein